MPQNMAKLINENEMKTHGVINFLCLSGIHNEEWVFIISLPCLYNVMTKIFNRR